MVARGPDISASERLSRGYELWRKTLGTTRRLPGYEESMPEIDAQILDRIEANSVAHVLKNGIVTKLNESGVDGAGDVLDDLYGNNKFARSVYSWLSGVSHGDPWILSESFEHLRNEDGTGLVHTTANSRLVGVLAQSVVMAYVSAVDRRSTLMHWDEWERWSRYFRKRVDQVRERLD